MKQTPEKETSQKKPYIAPKVMKVDLTPEEVSLGFCKVSAFAANGRTNAQCFACATSYGS